MTIQEKKAYILRLIKLGMEPYKVYMLTECTDAEVAALEADEPFQRQLTVEGYLIEKDLLDKLHSAIELNSAEGGTTEIRWLLERLSPKRFGNRTTIDEGIKTPTVVEIVLDD